MIDSKITPKKSNYSIAGGILLAGIILFTLYLSSRTNDLLDKMPQLIVPATHDVKITETGTYTLFYEYESTVDDKLYSTVPDFPSMQLQIFEVDNLITIPLLLPEAQNTFSFSDRSGVSVAEFKIVEPATYRIIASPRQGAKQSPIVLSVSNNFSSKMFWTMVGSILIGALFLGTSVTIAMVTWQKRKLSRALLEAKYKKMAKIPKIVIKPVVVTTR